MTETYTAMVMPGPGQPPVPIERNVPTPATGEVLVRVRATSMNYHDLVNMQGLIDGPWPRVPMADGAGEVVAVGPGVTEFATGRRVFAAMYPSWLDGPPAPEKKLPLPGDTCDGWLQQYRLYPAAALVATPSHLTDAEAATLPSAGVTAWSALESSPVGDGDVVVTQGTGGVSLFALQLAKARGATVILTSSSDVKLALGASMGADHLINYRSTPNWQDTVRTLTDGRGADLVVELGGPETFPQSVAATRMGGTVAVIGVLTGFGNAELPVAVVLWENLRLIGITVGSVQAHRDLAAVFTEHAIHPHISHTVSWDRLAEAGALMTRGAHTGKIAVEIP